MAAQSVASPAAQTQRSSVNSGQEASSPALSGSSRSSSMQSTLGNEAIQSRIAEQGQGVGQDTDSTSGLAASTKVLPKPLPGMIGNVGYYQARNNDYLSRHGSPPPPDYYLNYGNKYARRFTTVLRPKLSADGQRWLDKAFVLLQTAMENRLVKDRAAYDALEMDNDAFRSFAYGTHPDAYLAGGLSGLGPVDLAKIASTPDLGDLLTLDGVSQVVETGARLVPQWGAQAYEGAKDLGGRALDSASEGIEAAWDWATDW